MTGVAAVLREAMLEWRNAHAANLQFAHRTDAIVAAVVLLGVSAAVFMGRTMMGRTAERTQVAVPAVLDASGSAWTSLVRHGPLVLVLSALPFFLLALADPLSSLAREQVSYPGRRIALMIDASSSMMARFPAAHLNATAPNEASFVTSVAAAETFIRRRMSGRYHDLIGLIEFGDEAYVVTPFTSDYENVLLSLSLIGNWTEFMNFPDQGTTIGLAIAQGVGLFKAFDSVDAAGNLMLIFSDGQDTQVTVRGRDVNDILNGARQTKIPVYFVRTSHSKGLGAVLSDDIWKPAVEATGGRFYPASDESALLDAIKDIDVRSVGRMQITRYSSQRPMFGGYAFMAAAFWTIAVALQLTVPCFRKFP